MQLSFKIILLTYIVFIVLATADPLSNDVISNYFMGEMSEMPFPFSMNHCQNEAIYGGSYVKYTCIDTQTVKKQVYSYSDCSDDSPQETIYSQSSNADFRCDATDSYAALKLTILDNTCSTGVDIYPALDVCTPTPEDEDYSYAIYCSDNYAEMQLYKLAQNADASMDSCDDSFYRLSVNTTNECSLFQNYKNFAIYARVNECVVSSETAVTDTPDNGGGGGGGNVNTETRSPHNENTDSGMIDDSSDTSDGKTLITDIILISVMACFIFTGVIVFLCYRRHQKLERELAMNVLGDSPENSIDIEMNTDNHTLTAKGEPFITADTDTTDPIVDQTS